MNKLGILSVQLDRDLRRRLEAFREQAARDLGRHVRDSEAVRLLLRRSLADGVPLTDSGYTEGWRAGMAAAKEAFSRGVHDAHMGTPIRG